MAAEELTDTDYTINKSTYAWSVRVFRTLRKLLSVNFKLHSDPEQIEKGNILLFNHFARFETFIPQYLLYEETGIYCSAVAAAEFFRGDQVLANYLRSVGAVPHDHARLFPILARQILRGRKVIIFPEGGMVKDRRVLDGSGQYSIYSRTSMDRRKQHTGASVLALGLDIYKAAVRQAYAAGDETLLEAWTQELGLDDVGALLTACMRPTIIIPSNITFYPIRVNDNILRKGAQLLNDGLTRRHSEELLIEGNILLKDTDMDIRLGEPINSSEIWDWRERKLMTRVAPHIKTLDQAYQLKSDAHGLSERMLAGGLRQNAKTLRNDYMHSMYSCVTINLSHLASAIIMQCISSGNQEIDRDVFHKALYLAVKKIQKKPGLHLHRSLLNPESYGDLLYGRNAAMQQFTQMAESSDLIEPCDNCYRFLPKLLDEHDFDEIRMENLVAVYANEITPLTSITDIIDTILEESKVLDNRELARYNFDDEVVSWRWDKAFFSKPYFDDINKKETATESSKPVLLFPKNANGAGIVLVHGFLASPAEMRGFAEKLADQGYTAIVPRLKGHGTSPYDLREKSWEDWYSSIRRAYRCMQAFADRVVLVGFSTGGALALKFAADQPDELLGIAAVSVPIRFKNSKMMFVPLMHGTNKVVRWFSSYEGIKPFLENNSEHPAINYRHMPIRGLYELRRLVSTLESRLADIHCPALIVQGDKDPVVDPKSANIIHKKLGADYKTLLLIESDRHGILMDDVGGTQQQVVEFLNTCISEDSAMRPKKLVK